MEFERRFLGKVLVTNVALELGGLFLLVEHFLKAERGDGGGGYGCQTVGGRGLLLDVGDLHQHRRRLSRRQKIVVGLAPVLLWPGPVLRHARHSSVLKVEHEWGETFSG